MLAGPPRLLSIISALVLVCLGVWYLKVSHRPLSLANPAIVQPHTPDVQTQTPDRDPLDFSIPLRFKDGAAKPAGSNYSHILVVPRAGDEDISWMDQELKDTPRAVYEVTNPNAKYHVPENKGREAMVYLTYIIDHYDDLPDTVIFAHSHRHAWHNNVIHGLDAAQMIQRLNHDRVHRQGYMNLRCHHNPGCPDWIHLDRPGSDFDFIWKPEEIHFRRHVWEELHPGAPIPFSLSGICCAQFAVSRNRIREVPLERFYHYRNWLLKTPMEDRFSGRIFEYIWHYIFTGHEVYCPSMNTCYCDGYGICFGGREKFQYFIDKLDERNKIQEDLDGKKNHELEKANEEGDKYQIAQDVKEKMEQLGKTVKEMDAELEGLRTKAFTAGEERKNRELEMETYDDSHIWDFAPKDG